VIAIFMCFVLGDLKWSEVMLREPIARSAPAPTPPPSPRPSPKPDPDYPKTACFCDDCKPCKCRDGKHSPGCSEGKPAIEIKPEPAKKYRAYGGSGAQYEHENEQFLNDWIRINDPGYSTYYAPCPSGTCPNVRTYVR